MLVNHFPSYDWQCATCCTLAILTTWLFSEKQHNILPRRFGSCCFLCLKCALPLIHLIEACTLIFSFIFIYLFCCSRSSFLVCELLGCSMWDLALWPGSNPAHLQREYRILATGPPILKHGLKDNCDKLLLASLLIWSPKVLQNHSFSCVSLYIIYTWRGGCTTLE